MSPMPSEATGDAESYLLCGPHRIEIAHISFPFFWYNFFPVLDLWNAVPSSGPPDWSIPREVGLINTSANKAKAK